MHNVAYKINNSDFRVGIYTRISVEEKVKSLADSIANQKAILTDYVKKNDFNLVKIYEDDGRSGGNFNRPAFKQMLCDIETGYINCVVVKDLARFGREYIETGNYIEKYFPERNVRFISAIENLDSFADPERMQDIDVPIRNIFNEDYLKRTSKSTKSILNVKRRDGEFVGAIVPYGYMRSTTKKNQLIVDEEVRDIVKRIFELYSNYKSYKEIANILNDEGIASPMARRKQLKGEICTNISLWSDNSVRNILKQEIYTGDMVQGMTKSYSYKVKKRVLLPREQWTIVPNTHEALVEKELFITIQDMMSLKSKPMTKKRNTKPSVINGLLICGKCGKKMHRTIVNKKNKDYYYYSCKNCKIQDGHKLLEENTIIDIVLITLNTIIDNMLDIEAAIQNKDKKIINQTINKLKKQISAISNEYSKFLKAKGCLYADFISGDLTQNEYNYMKVDFEEKCTSLNARRKKLERELHDYLRNNLKGNEAISTYKKYKGIKLLDRRTAVYLIKQIIVDEQQAVKIIFKFDDEIKKYQCENL